VNTVGFTCRREKERERERESIHTVNVMTYSFSAKSSRRRGGGEKERNFLYDGRPNSLTGRRRAKVFDKET
jgi:hypothetical protein